MTDTEVVVVSLAIGFGIGVVLLMVLWACRACLGKPNTADDDTAANIPPRRQSAMTSEDTGQRVNVQLSSRPEQVRQDASATSQSPKVQRTHPPAAIHFPNEAVTPSPHTLPSPGPGPTAPGTVSAKASPQLVIPGGPMAFASPSPLPTRLSDHAMQFADTPSPQPVKANTADSSTSAASSMVTATPTPGNTSTTLPPAIPTASLSTTTSHQPPAAVPTLAELDPTVPEPTPTSGLLAGAQPQETMVSPLPSAVPTLPSGTVSSVSTDPQVVTVGDGIPMLNLDPVNEARAKRHNVQPRTYPDPTSSAVGTTAELGPISDLSGIPNTASTAQTASNAASTAPGSYRMPAPQKPVSATHSLESHQALALVQAATQDASKTSATDIQSHQIEEENSGAVSDATVTLDGLTMREIVDDTKPAATVTEAEEMSFTTALGLADGVEAVEGSGSFATADTSSTADANDVSPGISEQDQESKPEPEAATAAKGGPEGAAEDDGAYTSADASMSMKRFIPDGHVSTTASGRDLLSARAATEGGDDDEEEFESVGTPYTGMDTTRTVGAQSLAFMEGGQRHNHNPQALYVPDGVQIGNDQEHADLPPGAVMRGRDPLMDRLMSKLSQDLPDGFSRTNSQDLLTPDRSAISSAVQSPLGTPGTTHALAGRNGLGEQKSSMSLSDNYRFIPDSNHDSLMSIPYNPAHGFPGETDTIGNSVAISEASEWTLSAGTRAVGGPSSALSRGTGAPSRRYVPGYADSLASGFSAAFSEASDWTLSGGNTRQIPGLRGVPSRRGQAGGFSPLPSPSTRSQLGQSNGITSGFTSRSLAASNWTLSGATGKLGAPSTRFSQGSRALDDGRSIAFTDGGSEWALSPRSAVVRDDVDVGHSARWMSPDEIKMPARLSPEVNNTRGLRDKFEQKTLRQKYASDDTNVPETAVRRVNDWMGEMEDGTRDEVMLRLTAQQNDF